MKKFLYLLTAVAVAGFAGCSDQNDVVDGLIDEIRNKPVSKHIEYTLTAADYSAISAAAKAAAGTDAANVALAEAVGQNLALNEFATAGDFVPATLAKNFPALSGNSTVQVSYAYTEPYLANLAPLPYKTLAAEDFEGYTASASSPYTKWELGGWKQFITKGGGTKFWQVRAYGGNQYGQVSANGGVAEQTEIYMVSPAIAVTEPRNNNFSFDVCVGYWNSAGLAVLVSEDTKAATEPASALWTDVTSNFTIPTEPASGYGTFAPAGTMTLDPYAGKTIYIAFRYNGETGMGNPNRTTTYQIDNIRVVNGDTSIAAVPGAAYLREGATGAWSLYENGVSPLPGDYVAMGATATAPYLKVEDAPAYLPAFLSQKFPYARQDDIKAVTWNVSARATAADEYIFTDGRWVRTAVGGLVTEQAVYTDGKGWWFDPTVNHTLTKSDYQMVVDRVFADPVLGVYRGNYADSEWYYGFSAAFNNVSFRLTGSSSSSRDTAASKNNDTELHALDGRPAEQAALLWSRLEQKGMPLFLALKYPKAKVQVSGTEVLYHIGFAVYYPDGVTNTTLYYIATYKVATAGASGVMPTFTLVERKEVPQAELP